MKNKTVKYLRNQVNGELLVCVFDEDYEPGTLQTFWLYTHKGFRDVVLGDALWNHYKTNNFQGFKKKYYLCEIEDYEFKIGNRIVLGGW